jgi:uncharacterized membrane protein YdjX (TVP38/TMEM64 family)
MENASQKPPGRAGRKRTLWFWLAVATVVALLAALLYAGVLQDWIDDATDWAKEHMDEHPVLGALVFFGFSALSAMLAFASSVVLVPPANLAWGQAVTFVLLWGGWLAGATVAYGIGRLAHPLLVHVGYEEKLRKYEQFVNKRMKFWAVLLLCMAVPSEIPGYLCGSAHYPLAKFIAAMAIAEGIYALGATIAAETVLEAEPLPLMAAGAALVAVATVSGLLLRRFARRKSARASGP